MKRIHLACLLATTALALPLDARELTFGMQDNEAHPLYAGAQAMAERLEALSDGEMTMTIFPSSQLGDFRAMVEQVQEGELDLVLVGYPDLSYAIPELLLVGEPYVINDYDHLLRVIDGEYGQEMEVRFNEIGLQLLDVWYLGTRHTTANRLIESIDDLAGLRLRTPNVPFLINYAEAVGATPAPVAFAEVYLALQTNQVDAQENPLPTIEAMRFYEVQNSIALTGHFVASSVVQIGRELWDTLSEEERGWLEEAVAAGREVNNDLVFEGEERLIAFFEEEGLTVTRPDLAPFREAMEPYYEALEARFGEGRVRELMEQ